ncbi:MAG: S-adenosylmethionine decarboxylase [Armatimonadota bacterium]
MKKLAPDIYRQRLLIEGYYGIGVNKHVINKYFKDIVKSLELKIYGKPIIFSPGGLGKKKNQGYDAFVPLIDSGISVYVWSNAKFISVLIYSCKKFIIKKAVDFTRDFFGIDKMKFKGF